MKIPTLLMLVYSIYSTLIILVIFREMFLSGLEQENTAQSVYSFVMLLSDSYS